MTTVQHRNWHVRNAFLGQPVIKPMLKQQPGYRRAAHLRSCQQLHSISAHTSTQSAGHTDIGVWTPPAGQIRHQAPHAAPPIVILPGFGNNSNDYIAPFGNSQEGIVQALQNRSYVVYVVEVERRNWLQVSKSLATRAYWSGNSTVDPGYRWYLHKVQAAVEKACRENDCSQVDLVGHSAGGWLARAFVGDALYIDRDRASGNTTTVAPGLGAGPLPRRAHQGVRRLVTLGTPHLGPSTGGRDMTGGTLTWLNKTWPGACFHDQGIQYTCVAGHLVHGNKDAPRRTLAKYACNSYREVCGDGHGQPGDGVVPICCAHLEGAQNITLEGVFHSISRSGTFADCNRLVWYGSEDVVDSWLHALA